MTTLFISRFNKLPKIAYNPLWGNGTGYFDFAVNGKHAPVLLPGEQVAAITDNNRKLIITGTQLGNIVVFQRYSDREDILVYNASREFNSIGLIINKRLSVVETEMIIGNEDNFDKKFNIANVLKNISVLSKHDSWVEADKWWEGKSITVQLGESCDTRYIPEGKVLLIGKATLNGNGTMYGLINLGNVGVTIGVVQLNREIGDNYMTSYMFPVNVENAEQTRADIICYSNGADVNALEVLVALNLNKANALDEIKWESGN